MRAHGLGVGEKSGKEAGEKWGGTFVLTYLPRRGSLAVMIMKK